MDEYVVFSNGWMIVLWLTALLITLGVWVWASRKKSLGLIEDAKIHIRKKRQAEKSNLSREKRADE